jgi:hypothetical protein
MRSRGKQWAGLLGLFSSFLALSIARAADVLTQHNDNARTGANTAETLLTTANVRPNTFGKLWTLYVDGQIVAQPLYVSKLAIDTSSNANAPLVKGTFNAVVIATMHNTIYVYDADKENPGDEGRTKPLWATWLGKARPGNKDKIDMWSTNDPEWGVVSTPVIDEKKETLWVVAWHNDEGIYRYRLHALNLRSGAPVKPPVVIGGAPLNAQNPCKYAAGFDTCSQKQRAALLLADGVVYVAFGGDGNPGNVFAFDGKTLVQRAFWASTTPPAVNGGIWQSGLGPSADDAGNVYLITGNGTFDAHENGPNYGNSFVRLRLEASTLSVKDYFTPCDQAFLDKIDLDFGSGGAVLIPGTQLTFGGGKAGVIYLLSRDNLGHYTEGPGGTGCKNPNALQEFQATDIHMHGAGTTYGHIHSSPVFWKGPDKSRIYVWGENDRLKAYGFNGTKFTNIGNPTRSIYQPPNGMPGGMLSLSSNGQKAGTGILWAVVPLDGDANLLRGVQGVVLALDAQDVSKQLWTSEVAGVRDRLGLFAKYVPPTVAGGKVFVATYGDTEPLRQYANDRPKQFPNYQVTVYGMLPAEHPHDRPIINQGGEDVTVTKAVATDAITLDTQTCVAANAGNVDCTAALSKKTGAPAFHTLIVPVGYGFAGCKLLKVTTASKQTGLAASTGIGWYAADALAGNQAMTSGRFVPTGSTKQVGAGTLKSGAPALLHEFVGVANCSVGQASFDKLFKPYMQFDNSPDGKIYRNWDLAQDYRISRAVTQFDRTGDVLNP